MYIKFLAHGKGDPAKAASYLIDEVDHLNRPRADVQVLREIRRPLPQLLNQ
jgi:hypothetical protein